MHDKPMREMTESAENLLGPNSRRQPVICPGSARPTAK
jgi:hypothetical protein